MKGRVIAIGATEMHLDRRTFYDKGTRSADEHVVRPRRYDRSYEEGGNDYPLAYVRWTENRNLDAFLNQIAAGAIDPGLLDTEELPFDDALGAYDSLAKASAATSPWSFVIRTPPRPPSRSLSRPEGPCQG